MKDLRVLLVEDDPLIRLSTEDQLADCGCQVVAVRDGEQAMEALRGQSFDVLFADARLPAMSGLELIRLARGDWPALKVILASGYGDLTGSMAEAGEGVVALPKPYSMDGIQKAFGKVMGTKN